jgi:peptidoglycan/LPS O-acetylase OafA/YrhL
VVVAHDGVVVVTGTWRLGRRPALDGLRGVAVLLVFGYHGLLLAGADPFPAAGNVGVTLFFALSGFLITALLLEELAEAGRISLARFYARRARRLLPALVVLTAACVGIALVDRGFTSGASALAALLYVQNWWQIAHPAGTSDALRHTWSLSIEEQFYVAWPVILICLARFGRRAIIVAALAGAGLSVALRVELWGHAAAWRIYAGTDTRADALLMGCALAAAMQSRRVRRVGTDLLAGISVLLLIPAVFMQQAGYHVIVPALAGLCGCGLILTASTRGLPALSTRWLRWFGARSYGLYLWHVPVMFLVTGLPWPLAVPLFVSASIGLTALSWRYVEQPFRRRRRMPSRSPHVELAATSDWTQTPTRP